MEQPDLWLIFINCLLQRKAGWAFLRVKNCAAQNRLLNYIYIKWVNLYVNTLVIGLIGTSAHWYIRTSTHSSPRQIAPTLTCVNLSCFN